MVFEFRCVKIGRGSGCEVEGEEYRSGEKEGRLMRGGKRVCKSLLFSISVIFERITSSPAISRLAKVVILFVH